MSAIPPNNVNKFNPANFPSAKNAKLNFPVAQGTIYCTKGIQWGDSTFQNSKDSGKIGLKQIVAPTSTFNKADYPWVKRIRVVCLGGGGAGGGLSDGNGDVAKSSSGGSGGSFAESWITDIANLPDQVTITVGSGGTSTGSGQGGSGGSSSFGNIVVATGGTGGNGELTGNVGFHFNVNPGVQTTGTNVGDITFYGFPSENATSFGRTNQFQTDPPVTNGIHYVIGNGSDGGSSFWGRGGKGGSSMTVLTSPSPPAIGYGGNGEGFGAGGGGSAVSNISPLGVDIPGGAGSDGFVYVELWGGIV